MLDPLIMVQLVRILYVNVFVLMVLLLLLLFSYQKNRCIRVINAFGFVAISSRGARDSKIGKKWSESSRILDYIIS